MKMNFKKSALTLSEIMITLSLIGFLATMTLSTIGSSVQQRSRLAQYRAAISKMSSVIRSITSEDGQMYQCYSLPNDDEIKEYGLNIENNTPASTNTGCRTLTDRFIRAMGATKFCEGDAVDLGCLPRNYPPADACFKDYDNVGAYVLDNSMIIITDAIGSMRNFAVDVNGRKGPNKWGQDIFMFSVKATESVNSRGNIFVTQLGVLPGDYPGNSCKYEITSSATKSGYQMIRESAGLKNKKKASVNWKKSDDEPTASGGGTTPPFTEYDGPVKESNGGATKF